MLFARVQSPSTPPAAATRPSTLMSTSLLKRWPAAGWLIVTCGGAGGAASAMSLVNDKSSMIARRAELPPFAG